MFSTTVARESFLIRLRVQSDGSWAGQVEHIRSGWEETFHDPQQLLERLTATVGGPAREEPPSRAHRLARPGLSHGAACHSLGTA